MGWSLTNIHQYTKYYIYLTFVHYTYETWIVWSAYNETNTLQIVWRAARLSGLCRVASGEYSSEPVL